MLWVITFVVIGYVTSSSGKIEVLLHYLAVKFSETKNVNPRRLQFLGCQIIFFGIKNTESKALGPTYFDRAINFEIGIVHEPLYLLHIKIVV